MSTFDNQIITETNGRHTDAAGGVIKSPKGATGIAQVMPSTGPEAARYAGRVWDAALFNSPTKEGAEYNLALGSAYKDHLLTVFDGDDRKATAAYNAGPGYIGKLVKQHGAAWESHLYPETSDYLRKTFRDSNIHSTPDPIFAGTSRAVPRPKMPTVDDLISGGNGDAAMAKTNAELDAMKRERPSPTPSVSDMMRTALTGGDGVIQGAPDNHDAVRAEDGLFRQQQQDQAQRAGLGFVDRAQAAWGTTFTARLIDTIGEKHQEFDPAFIASQKAGGWEADAKLARDDREAALLDSATSAEHRQHIIGQIAEERKRNETIDSNDTGTLFRLGAGLVDPVSLGVGLATGGVGKAAGLADAAYSAGRAGRVAYAMGENAVGNLAITAGLDATGEYTTGSDYAMSAATGLLVGIPMGLLKRGPAELAAHAELQSSLAAGINAERRVKADLREQAKAELGPDAAPEAVEAKVEEKHTQAHKDLVQYILAPVPDNQKLMVGEHVLTDHPEVKAAIEAGHDMASVSNAGERAAVTEQIARSEQIVRNNPIDTASMNTVLERVGLESTAMRLLKSKSDVAKAAGMYLLENPTGAGGRSRTAAMATAMRSRMYNEHFSRWDGIADTYRRQEGVTRFNDFITGKSRNQFNDRVFYEVEGRGGIDHVPDANPHVRKAADLFEEGMDIMRIHQQHVDAVGAVRLGLSSTGYVPHRLDPRRVMELTGKPGASAKVRALLSAQFQELEGFDAKFADKLGAQYLERAILAAHGNYAVPMNLHSPEAGQIVRDLLEQMNLPKDDLDKIVGKFSRGGAGHTKARLKLDLSADIGDGQKLGDLFVKDMPTLYRSYSRRVAGDVSLAQYGIMGKKGLDVMRRAIEVSGGSPKDLGAFDQVAAEFLNTPYGTHNHKWMDNLRIATSAARLGGMAFTQAAEFGNAIPAIGIARTLQGVASLPRLMVEVAGIAKGTGKANPILQSFDLLGGHNGLEDYHLTRLFDVRDNDVQIYGSEAMGLGSRALREASHAVLKFSGHRILLASQTRSMSEQIVHKAFSYIRAGKHDVAMDDMGINAGLRDAIRADMDKIATFDSKGNLTKLDLLQGSALRPSLVQELVQAIERGAGQIIQRTYIGETGAWAHNGLLKLLLQFRTFSLISVEKQWGRNVNNYGAMKSAMMLAGSASFAVPIYLARLQTNMLSMSDAAKRQEYWDKNSGVLAITRAVMNYASASGLTGDIADVVAGFASNYGGDFGDRLGTDYNVRGKRTDQLVGGVIAPGAGLLQDLWGGIMHADAHKVARSLPGGNLPYVSPWVAALPGPHQTTPNTGF